MASRATTAGRAARLLAEAGPTVSVTEAAAILGICRDTAYALAKRGELPARVLKLGRSLRVSTADLRREVGGDGPDGETAA